MIRQTYTTDAKEVYTLELEKLRRCFSEMHKVGEEASELSRVGWRQVEYLRHINFIMMEAVQAGETLLKIGS